MLAAPRTLGTVYRRSLLMSNISWHQSISVIASSSASNLKDSPVTTTRPFVPGTHLHSSFQIRRNRVSYKKKKGPNHEFRILSEVGVHDIKARSMDEVHQKVGQKIEIDPEDFFLGYLTLQIGVPEQGGEWQAFRSFDQVEDLKREHEGSKLSLQIKEFADDLDPDRDFDLNQDLQDDLMIQTVNKLMGKLHADGWVFPEDAPVAAALAPAGTEVKLTLTKGDVVEEASSLELVLRYAEHDPELLDVLVVQIGALDHISKCLQFRFLWKELLDVDKKHYMPTHDFDDEDLNEEIVGRHRR